MIASKGVGKNTTYLTFALVVQKVLSFVYFWFVSTALFPEILGRYIFALSFASLFAIFVDLGITPILIRESSKDTSKANQYLQNVISIKIPLAILTISAMVLIISISPRPMEVKKLVYLASIIMLFDAFTLSFWGIFRSFRNMFWESTSIILVQVIIFSAGITVLKITGNTLYLMGVLVVASMFNFLYSAYLIRSKLRFSLLPKWDKRVIAHFMRLVPVFALGGIFAKVYLTADTVILGFLAGDRDVGFYAVPAKTLTALSQVIPAAFAAVIFPVFSKYFVVSKERLHHIVVKSFEYLLILSIPMTLGLFALIPNILTTLWPKYSEVGFTFRIMSLALPFIFLAFVTGYLLNACDRQKNNTINRGVMAGLTVFINILLIPLYGYIAAGITFFLVNVVVFFMDYHFIKKVIPIRFRDYSVVFAKIIAASAIMAAVAFVLCQYTHFLIVVVISAIIYAVLVKLFRIVEFSEIKNRLTH